MRVLPFRHVRAAGLLAVAAIVACPPIAWAHAGRPPEPHDLWSAWAFEPAVVAGLVAGAALYARGVRTLWRAAGPGRGIRRWRVACFAGGLAAVALALLSPIDTVGTALFSVHMVQHLLLIVVAAPLLVLGDGGTGILWSLSLDGRRGVGAWWRRQRALPALWHRLRRPLVALALHLSALWLWHVPAAYDAALSNEAVHVAEHACFFLTALLFWYPVADPHRRARLGVGPATLYLFVAGLQGTLLGALITFARHPWYAAHYGTTVAWGLTPLEDQQIAGLVMWIPAGFVYLGALIATVLPALQGTGQFTAPAVSSSAPAAASARGTP
jgi:cytochrome c oxidase assembly factor CtaG